MTFPSLEPALRSKNGAAAEQSVLDLNRRAVTNGTLIDVLLEWILV